MLDFRSTVAGHKTTVIVLPRKAMSASQNRMLEIYYKKIRKLLEVDEQCNEVTDVAAQL
jgi:hypothetical protein